MSKFEQYQKEWEKESQVDMDQLGSEPIRIAVLRTKWLKRHYEANLLVKHCEQEAKEVMTNLRQFYSRKCYDPKAVLEALGRDELPDVDADFSKEDLKQVVEADPLAKEALKKLYTAQARLEYIEQVIEQIKGMSYLFSAAIKYRSLVDGDL